MCCYCLFDTIINFFHEKTGIWVNANDDIPEGDAIIKEFMDKFAYTVPQELRPALPNETR